MGTLYRIRDWDTLYENNRTRELKHLAWVPIPNKHDSDGFTQVMSEPDGLELYGAWVVIVQLASRCGVRGTLLRDGAVPHNSASISRITRAPEKNIIRALEYFSTAVNWLISEPYKECDNPAPSCENPAPHRQEQNRTEGNGKEGTECNENPPAKDAHWPPTFEEFAKYETGIGLKPEAVRACFDWHSKSDFMRGNTRITNYRSCLSSWKNNEGRFNGTQKNQRDTQPKAEPGKYDNIGKTITVSKVPKAAG